MARSRWWLGLLLAAVLCGGCDGDVTTGPAGSSSTPLPELTYTPVHDADTVTAVPSPLAAEADLGEAVAASRGAPDRLSGEYFALQAAQVVMDVRKGAPGARVLDLIASPAMPDDVRRYLVEEIDGQRALGTRRSFDTSPGFWIKSRSIGPGDAPNRLETEIAGVMTSVPWSIRTWHRARYDVVREGGRWSLVNYAVGGLGPETSPLTPAERREFLPGPGWRFVPPA